MEDGRFVLVILLYLVAPSWSSVGQFAGDSDVGLVSSKRSFPRWETLPQGRVLTTNVNEMVERIKKSVDAIMMQKIQRTKELYKLPDTTTRHRGRRDIPDQLTEEHDDFYDLIAAQSLPAADITNCFDVESFSHAGNQYIVGATTGPSEQTILYRYNNGTSSVLQVLETPSVKDVEPFEVGSKTYLIVMASDSQIGSTIYQFFERFERFSYIQRVLTRSPTKVEAYATGVYECVIFVGAFVRTVEGVTRRVSAIYRWEGGHLDETNAFITGSAVDVRPFQIQSHLFVALANHTDSNILQYIPHLDTFVRYQDIELTNAVDWEHFYLGSGKDEDHFLAVAIGSDGPATSLIFKFHHNEFVPFQSIATVGAKLWHAVNNADGTLRVLALSSSEGISFYLYNGWIFQKSQIVITTPGVVEGMASFIESGHMILALADNATSADNVYDLRFAANSAVQDLHRNAESTCDRLIAEVERLDSRLDKILNASKNLVYVNASEVQIITGNKTFQDSVTMHTVEASEIHADNGMILDANEKVQFSEVKANQTQSFADLSSIKQQLDGAVWKMGSEQTIRGQKTFRHLTAADVSVDTVNVGSDVINTNVNLTELQTNTWHRQDQIVDVEFTIDGNVTVLGNLTVSGTLDGLATSTIVTLSRNHTIIGDKTFQSPAYIQGNLDVRELIDDVMVHESNLLLTYGSQTIRSNLNTSGIVTFLSDVEVDGLVDGCDLIATINRDGVLTSGNFTVSGNKVFVGDVIPETGIAMGPGHTIDGVDIQDLNQTLLRTSGYQEVTAIYSFSQNVSISGNLVINGHIDGLRIPDDILVVNSPSQAILAGSWVLGDNVTVENITVETSINNIQATGGGTGLEVLLIDGHGQTVEGAITFAGGLHLEGSSHVAGLVDGVHIPSMTADVVYKHGNQLITGIKTFVSNVRFQQDLLIDELINGINITQYDSSAVKLVENGPVILNGDVELTALETNMAGPLITEGRHSFPRRTIYDLVIQGEDDIVYGTKSFVGVASDENVEASTVNGINISHYYLESVRVIPGQLLVIDRNVTFWDDVKMILDLDITSGIIDDVFIPDLITLTKGSVKSLTTFTRHVTTQALNVNHLTLSGLLNGYDIVTVDGDTLKQNAKDPQNVAGTKTFLNGMFVNGDLIVWGNTVGVDLSALAQDAVYVHDQHTVITAEKFFEGFVDVEDIDARDHVDGVHLPSFSERVVLQLVSQTIQAPVDFTQEIHFSDNLTVVKTVNDHIIGPELLEILNVWNNTYEDGLEFSEVIAEDSVTVDGRIDGFYMDNFVLRDSEFQTLSGDKRFTGNLTVDETAIVLLINDVSIDDLNAIAVRRHHSSEIQGNKTFAQGLVLEQNLTVTFLVDGVDVETLQANFEQMRNEVNEFSINNTLIDVTILGNISIVNSTYKGVDLQNLAETYMSKSLPQVVTGHSTWWDTVTIAEPASLNAQSIRLGGRVNEVDLEEFDQSVWVDGRGDRVGGFKTFTKNTTLGSITPSTTDETTTLEGSGVMETTTQQIMFTEVNSLSIAGLLNGLNMSSIMLLHRANIVTGFKTFTGSPFVINGDMNMRHWMEIDGVDLSEFKRNAVTIVDDVAVTLPTFVEGIILRKHLFVDGEVDGVTVSRDNLLLTTGIQEITGVKTFIQDLSVHPATWIYGLLNSVDLDDFLYNTLLIGPNQTVTGDYTFISEIVLSNATTIANVNDIRIPELYHLVYTYSSVKAFNQSLQARCQMLNKMHQAQLNTAILLLHLELSQVIDTIGYNSWHAIYYNETQWLVLAYTTTYPSVACIPSEIYQWNEVGENYEYYKSLYPKSAVDVDSFVVNERLFLVIASKPNDTGECDNFPRLHPGDDMDGIVTLNRTLIPWYSYSTTNVLVWVANQETFYLFQALPCISPSDVEVFVDPLSNETCVVIANEVYIDTNGDMNTVLKSYVYCLQSLQSGFYLKDSFTTTGTSKIRHFFKDGTLHLAVANRVSTITNSFATKSAIFQQQSDGLFTEITTVNGNAVSDILPITIEGRTYVIIGNEFSGTINDIDYNIPVEVYKLTDANTLAFLQDLDAFGLKSLASFSVENQFYLILVDQLATTFYRYSGIDNFVKVRTISENGATGVHVFPLGDTGLTQVAISAYDEEPALIQGQVIHPIAAPSVILDFVLIGEKIPTLSCSNDTIEEEKEHGLAKFP